jgi:hypothetical protein
MNSSIAVISDELEHQQDKYGPEHDAQHVEKELARAALAYIRMYLAETTGDKNLARGYYPFDDGWSPENPRRCLVKAAAFIASELERIK